MHQINWDDDNNCQCNNGITNIINSFNENNSGTCSSYNTYNYACKYDNNGNCIIHFSDNYYTEDGYRNETINGTNEKVSIICKC